MRESLAVTCRWTQSGVYSQCVRAFVTSAETVSPSKKSGLNVLEADIVPLPVKNLGEFKTQYRAGM